MIRQFFLFLYPLLILECSKLALLVVNKIHLEFENFGDLLKIIFYSLRFDGFILLIFILPIFIGLIFVKHFAIRKFLPVLKWLYVFFVFILALVSIADIVYYRSALHRLSVYDIGVIIDNFSYFNSILEEYWYLFIVVLVTTLMALPVFNTSSEYVPVRSSRKQLSLKIVGLAFFFFVLIFDFYYGRVLTPSSIFRITRHQNLPAIINTPTEILFSYKFKAREKLKGNYIDSAIAFEIYPCIHQFTSSRAPKIKPNIAILLLEGGSAEDFKAGKERKVTMPFLDSLIGESLFFENFFANGLTSPSGFDAVLGGMPQFDRDYYSLGYSQNAADFAPRLLKNVGYSTYFFYGVNNFGASLGKAADYYGLSNKIGARDVKRTKQDVKNSFGIHDHIFFPQVAQRMATLKEPFLSVVYNVSTHYPFNMLPDSILKGLPKFSKPGQTVLHYYDQVLRNFFNEVKNQKWYQNATFIFVADHYSREKSISVRNSIDVFRIPMFIYRTNSILKGEYKKPAQQIDIQPSILEIAGYDRKFFAFGKSVFDSSAPRTAVNFNASIAQIVTENLLLKYDKDRDTLLGLFEYQVDSALKKNQYSVRKNQGDSLLLRLKAFMQVFSVSLQNNKMSEDTYNDPKD